MTCHPARRSAGAVDSVSPEFSKEVGYQLGLQRSPPPSGCKWREGLMKGATTGHAKRLTTRPAVLPVVSQSPALPRGRVAQPPAGTRLVILPDIEKRLEAFGTPAQGGCSGGAGTAEELFYQV